MSTALRAASNPAMAVNVGGPSFLLDEVRPRLLEVVRQLEDSLPR